MPRTGDNIHIPLPEAEAIRLLLKVKPDETMPRKRGRKSVWAANEEASVTKKRGRGK
jgi:hypothetical protein